MPIDHDRVIGAELAPTTFAWDDREVILYNLSIGAGDPPTEPRELAYAYEGGLIAIPTFGTIPPFSMMIGIASIEGLDVNLAQILHGEHELVVHGDIPTNGSVTQTGRVTDLLDRGKGALLVVEVSSTLDRTGDVLFTNRAGIYMRGEGGFGGETGPGLARAQPPDREPDHVVESPTLTQQALLYRQASGDLNPLHADPGFAALAGFPRPILHGLCTYGVVAKAVIASALEDDVTRFGSFAARFSGHVFPGETLVTSIWVEGEGSTLSVTTVERGLPVLSNARVTFA